MAREVRLWEWLRDRLKPVEGLHMRRVENLVSEGDPDVDGCWQGRYFELELKGCDRPKHGGKLVFDVRKSQIIWARRRWRAGGNVWFYVRVGRDRDVRRYLVPGKLFGLFESDVTEDDLVRAAVLPPGHTALELLQRAVTTSDLRS